MILKQALTADVWKEVDLLICHHVPLNRATRDALKVCAAEYLVSVVKQPYTYCIQGCVGGQSCSDWACCWPEDICDNGFCWAPDYASHSLLADVTINNTMCANAAGSCACEVEGGHSSPGLNVDGEDVIVAIHICGITLHSMTGMVGN